MAGPTSIVYMPVAREQVVYRLAETLILSSVLILTWYGCEAAVGLWAYGPTLSFKLKLGVLAGVDRSEDIKNKYYLLCTEYT